MMISHGHQIKGRIVWKDRLPSYTQKQDTSQKTSGMRQELDQIPMDKQS